MTDLPHPHPGGPLELSPEQWEPTAVYHLMTSLVIPRPIAWVSTLSPDGVPNVAPHSYFGMMAGRPPHVVFGSAGEKDTLRNVRASGELVVNIATLDLVEPMNFTATNFPSEESEFAWAGLTAAPSMVVAPPRVGEAKAHLECRVVGELPAGESFVVLCEVVHLHVDGAVWRDGRVDPELLDPVCRLSGSLYAGLGEVFRLPRPSWADVAGTTGTAAMPRR